MNRPSQETEERLGRVRPVLVSLAEALLSPALRGRIDASDLVQQTLMEAHAAPDVLNTLEEGPCLAWLRAALKNNLVDAVRHLNTAKNDIGRNVREADMQESFCRLEQLLIADETTPSAALQTSEEITQMLRLLQRLPENQRTAIMLKHLRGYSLREVSETLGVSEPSVAGLLHRGRRQLVQWMAEGSR